MILLRRIRCCVYTAKDVGNAQVSTFVTSSSFPAHIHGDSGKLLLESTVLNESYLCGPSDTQVSDAVPIELIGVTTNPRIVHAKWILPELKKAIAAAPAGVELVVSIYVTSGCPEDDDDAAEEDEKTAHPTPESPRTPDTIDAPVLDEQKASSNEASVDEKRSRSSTPEKERSSYFTGRSIGLNYDCVRVYYGRPDVHEILEDAVTTSEGPVSVDGELFAVIIQSSVAYTALV